MEGAAAMREAANVVLATTEPLSDPSAAILAPQFHAGIAAAQTDASPWTKCAMVAVALPDGPDLARLDAADEVDPHGLRLVRPKGGCG